MKKQYGMMGVGAMVGLALLGIVALGVVGAITAYYGAFNYRVDSEKVIIAEYDNMESILGQLSLKVSETAQVPGMYRDDLKEVMTAVMTARQGEGGSQAAFQWFKEHNIEINTDMYVKIQQIIESGRNKFENAQTKFIDTKRAYTATLEKNLFLSKGWWIEIAGGPQINLDDYVIISTEHAQDAFKTKVDKGFKLR